MNEPFFFQKLKIGINIIALLVSICSYSLSRGSDYVTCTFANTNSSPPGIGCAIGTTAEQSINEVQNMFKNADSFYELTYSSMDNIKCLGAGYVYSSSHYLLSGPITGNSFSDTQSNLNKIYGVTDDSRIICFSPLNITFNNWDGGTFKIIYTTNSLPPNGYNFIPDSSSSDTFQIGSGQSSHQLTTASSNIAYSINLYIENQDGQEICHLIAKNNGGISEWSLSVANDSPTFQTYDDQYDICTSPNVQACSSGKITENSANVIISGDLCL